MNMETNTPKWLSGNKMDEVAFVQEFLRENEMVVCDGALFTKEGRFTDHWQLKRMIFEKLQNHVKSEIARRVDSICRTIRMQCSEDPLLPDPWLIHLANGTLDLRTGFTPRKQVCRHRLAAAYPDAYSEPTAWLEFLDQLLSPIDIRTLQEYMGYCLVPTTKAQKMLMITGQGGEGKSRIGIVMKAIFGNNLSFGSIDKIERSPFARADLQHLLVMVDDDMKMEALHSTNYIKSIITAEEPMDLERKGEQSYQGLLTARIIAFGNGMLRALHDRSYGFFRRQIILKALPRDPNRMDDPYLSEKLKAERDAIFFWCLEGLMRLIGQNWQFTLSLEAMENLQKAQSEGNNIPEFLASVGYISFDFQAKTSSRQLYRVYENWCRDNALLPLAERSFSAYLREHSIELNLEYMNHVPIDGGKYARGFRGIRILD